jgi:hypothetical protein
VCRALDGKECGVDVVDGVDVDGGGESEQTRREIAAKRGLQK